MSISPLPQNRRTAQSISNFALQYRTRIITALSKWIQERVLPQAKNRAPRKTGNLRRALGIVSVTTNGQTVTFIIGWGRQAEYGRFQERGTKFVEEKRFVEDALRMAAPSLPSVWVQQVRIHGVGSAPNLPKTNVLL